MREKLLFRYSGALERGDFETLASVLAEAERDPILEQMILELNEAYGADLPALRPKETLPMTTVMTFDRQRPFVLRYSMVLVAAALILVIGLLALSGAGRDTRLSSPGGNGNDAALLQSSTATPTPTPYVPATATPVPMVINPAQAPELLVCLIPQPDTAVRVRSRSALDATAISLIVGRTTILALSATVNGEAIGMPPVASEQWSAWIAQGIDSPLWFFVRSQVDDAVIQGWVFGGESVQVIECPPTLGVVVPTVPPPEGMPSIVPTSTPLPAIDPMQLTATAIISEATVQAGGAINPDAMQMTATAIIGEATAQAVGVTPPDTEAQIAALSATIEALQAQIGTPTPTPMPLCVVDGEATITIQVRVNASDEPPLAVVRAGTRLNVLRVELDLDGRRWYAVVSEGNPDAFGMGYIRADQVREVTGCPAL